MQLADVAEDAGRECRPQSKWRRQRMCTCASSHYGSTYQQRYVDVALVVANLEAALAGLCAHGIHAGGKQWQHTANGCKDWLLARNLTFSALMVTVKPCDFSSVSILVACNAQGMCGNSTCGNRRDSLHAHCSNPTHPCLECSSGLAAATCTRRQRVVRTSQAAVVPHVALRHGVLTTPQ
jgi:hypothetical protein